MAGSVSIFNDVFNKFVLSTKPQVVLDVGAGSGKYVDLVSPEPGQSLPACAAPLKAPVFFSSKSHYVVYEYQTEDPKHTITQTFQLFKMANNEITKCKNDNQLTDAAQKTTKTQGVALSFKNAVMNLGCKQ